MAELPDLPLLISTILGGQLPIEERSARSISKHRGGRQRAGPKTCPKAVAGTAWFGGVILSTTVQCLRRRPTTSRHVHMHVQRPGSRAAVFVCVLASLASDIHNQACGCGDNACTSCRTALCRSVYTATLLTCALRLKAVQRTLREHRNSAAATADA
eukprot:scaffold5039_cov50-Phaeocystis_antarctica.AAC.6